ncbi:unnamed protein product [Gongylonema pulchrum]|uniref:UPF0020 domain-containing protein n=1 Tax=Gongylonema pulchrum TaxID=637853 RepID=A0A183DAF2_9BILA|nr:unnamed protein product [Gongylonema pulchrum]
MSKTPVFVEIPYFLFLKIGEALGFQESQVNLSSPRNVFYVIEEFDSVSLQKLYFGKLVGCGQWKLKNHYSLPSRCYIGNTTMDPELSFLQANIAQADNGRLVLDPFCGTGGILLAAAHFGAAVLGSEISYHIARAKGKHSNLFYRILLHFLRVPFYAFCAA